MRFNFIIIFLLCGFSMSAQFIEDFEDGNISDNPIWQGDVTDFIVANEGHLQLQAGEAGNSYIYTQTDYSDSLEIGFDLRLDFSPSGSNYARIYFLLDNIERSIANGYFVNIGKNGTSDNIEIFKIENGQETLIASGIEGRVANDPVILHLKLTKKDTDKWEVFTSYGSASLIKEFDFIDNSISSLAQGYFGIECTYTASRSDKFLFDNILVKEFAPDIIPPNLISADFIDEFTVQLLFDEALDISSAVDIANYNVQNVGKPFVAMLGSADNEVILEFSAPFEGSINYTVSVSGIKDLKGNASAEQNAQLFFVAAPAEGDLIITEILFDPYPNGKDFIEIYNVSDKSLQLQNLIISNTQRDETKVFTEPYIIEPGAYLAITEDINSIIEIYNPPNDANFARVDIPAFNNDAGNLTIKSADGQVIDLFDYEEDMHIGLIDDTEGVSLERLSETAPSNEKSNWSSGSKEVNFATPGYKNSNKIEFVNGTDDFFTTVNRTFSQNSLNNKYILAYDLQAPGYIANIKIYDSNGYRVKTLMSNELLGAKGFITWDGSDNDGNLVRLGIYLVVGEVYNEQGDVRVLKKTCILADNLD